MIEKHPSRTVLVLTSLVAVNTALLVASNAAGSKMISLPFGLAASATVFPYALSFLFTDVISEVFGKKAATMALRIGLLGVLLSVGFFSISIWAPAASFWDRQEAFELTLGLAPRLLLGGIVSYLVSQHLDVWIFHRLRELTEGRHLWLRNNASTLISQFVDTCIFISIAFYGIFPIFEAIVGQYLLKLIIALLDTPLAYLAIGMTKRYLAVDEELS